MRRVLKGLVEERKWPEALEECLRQLEEMHRVDALVPRYPLEGEALQEPWELTEVLRHVQVDVEEMESRGRYDLLWEMFIWGVGGVRRDLEGEAERYLRLGVKLGIPMLLTEMGKRLKMEFPEKSFKYFKLAARQRYQPAYVHMGYAYRYGIGAEVSLRDAAIWYHLAQEEGLSPLGSVPPLGVWHPRLHALVPPEMAASQRTAMLLCRRRRVPRDVALLVVGFICTH